MFCVCWDQRLFTRDNLVKINIITDASCPNCGSLLNTWYTNVNHQKIYEVKLRHGHTALVSPIFK